MIDFSAYYQSQDLLTILPLLLIAGWSIVVLVVDLWVPKDQKHVTAWLTLVGIVGTLVATAVMGNPDAQAFGGMVVVDGLAYSLNLIFLVTAAGGTLLAMGAFPRLGITRGEYYTLLLLSLLGMMLMSYANDLIMVFIAIELLSIPLYVLAGILRPRSESEEAAMKYFLLGAFSSGFLLYGIALIYGASGSTNIDAVFAADAGTPLFLVGMGLMLVGLGFKVAAAPFHMWTPDVYQGAPTVVTAYMSIGAKAGGFAALLRVFFTAFEGSGAEWAPAIAVVAAITMIIGNSVALMQTNIKRMLAYSAIAHAGYILMAVAAGGTPRVADFAATAAVIYLAAYAFTNLGAWGVVAALETQPGEKNQIDDFAGLGQQRPGMALAMALFMLSLTGIPPTIGFIGKFYVFQATLDAGLVWLAVVGVVTSVISAFYYLRIIIVMWMQPGEATIPANAPIAATVLVAGVVVLVLGLLPNPLFNFAQTAIAGLF